MRRALPALVAGVLSCGKYKGLWPALLNTEPENRILAPFPMGSAIMT